ncbi:MAG TPA: tetratricopeptide repeat protein [Mucilaginibacter sp.]|jgi:tetratricopeptide (TPR) repeat protein
MKRLLIILFLLQGARLFAQQEKSYVKKGNDLYKQQKYQEAEADYRKSVEKKNQNIEGNFNLGDALYKQKKFTDAGEQFNKLAGSANSNKALTAAAYHNMGNSLLENKKLEESIEAYKKSLLNNPKDDETRYNLAYAQEKLKKQQQQQKDNKNQDKKNQDKKNQDKKNQDNKNQDNKNKDQNKQNQDQDKKDQQKQQPDKLSKEDAERMLDALNNDEKQTQDKLKNKKFKGEKLRISKDW